MLLERPGGPKRCRAGSQEVSGVQGKPRAPERRPESFGRCLDDDFPIDAFFLSSLGDFCASEASRWPKDLSSLVPGGPWSPEGWLEKRSCPDGWRKRFGKALDGRVLDASGYDFRDFSILCPGSSQLLPCTSRDVKGSLQAQNGGLRALEEAWDDFLLEVFSRPIL